MLLIYTYKKIFKGTFSSSDLVELFRKLLFRTKYIIPFFLISSTNINDETTKIEKVSFSIIKKDTKIGFIDIEKLSTNQTTTYTINSEVNAKIIFNFNAVGREKSVYKKDTLIYSSVYRELNNKVKLDQSLLFIKGKYLLTDKNKKEVLNVDVIHRNLVTLFFFEPLGVQKIYSDKYKSIVKIVPIERGKYKVVFPKGNYNIFHYKAGKCILIEAVHTLYKVKLIPTS